MIPGSHNLKFNGHRNEQLNLMAWRMYLPGTDIFSFVIAMTENSARERLCAEFPSLPGNWAVGDVMEFDQVPFVVCVVSGARTAVEPVPLIKH